MPFLLLKSNSSVPLSNGFSADINIPPSLVIADKYVESIFPLASTVPSITFPLLSTFLTINLYGTGWSCVSAIFIFATLFHVSTSKFNFFIKFVFSSSLNVYPFFAVISILDSFLLSNPWLSTFKFTTTLTSLKSLL